MEPSLATIMTLADARSALASPDQPTPTTDELLDLLARTATGGDPLGWLLRQVAGSDHTTPGWSVGENGRAGSVPFPPGLPDLVAAAVACAIASRWSAFASDLPLFVPAPFHIGRLPAGDLGAALRRRATALGIGLAASSDGLVWRQRAATRMGGEAGEPLRALLARPVGATPALGGDSLTSFVVHNEPERDGIESRGELFARVGIEIGVAGARIDAPATAGLQRFAARVPSFMDGVWSAPDDFGIEIGWSSPRALSAQRLGELWHTWLGVLPGVTQVDVRLVSAPSHGRSAFLSEMRARARAYAEYRAGLPDAVGEVTKA